MKLENKAHKLRNQNQVSLNLTIAIISSLFTHSTSKEYLHKSNTTTHILHHLKNIAANKHIPIVIGKKQTNHDPQNKTTNTIPSSGSIHLASYPPSYNGISHSLHTSNRRPGPHPYSTLHIHHNPPRAECGVLHYSNIS